MASYDALRHLAIGQYIPVESPIHRLDPRAKLVAFGLLTLVVVIITGYLANLFMLGLVLTLVLAARLSPRYILSSVAPALPVIVVLALLQRLFYTGGSDSAVRVLLDWGPVHITNAGVRMVIVSLMRFVDLVFLTSLLTNTTTTGALTHGMESLLRPLSAIGLPGHELALTAAIALRFLPILGEQLESIGQAQASRGVSHQAQSRWRLARNARQLAALVVPLFVDVYRRSEEMIMAMQARCYQGGKGRTHLSELRFAKMDYVALIASALLLVGAIAAQRMGI